MKKKIKDITIEELKNICSGNKNCNKCVLYDDEYDALCYCAHHLCKYLLEEEIKYEITKNN